MSRACRICLKPTPGDGAYHDGCVRQLFGASKVPRFEMTASKLYTAALAMVGHTSLSGVQKKISVNLSADRETLQVAAEGGHYILKPQTETFPSLPENEHVTTCLAQRVGIDVPPFGMVPLDDGSFAYVSKRFDRLPDGHKVRQEDFCQLAEKPPKDKYDGSGELCVRLLRKYASEPLVEMVKLYRLFLFAWCTGNGDLHLKNISVLVEWDGVVRLTPAYDLVATRLVIPDDPLALPIVGKKDNLTRKNWLEFAGYCGIPERVAGRLLEAQASNVAESVDLIEASFLPADQRAVLRKTLEDRSANLR